MHSRPRKYQYNEDDFRFKFLNSTKLLNSHGFIEIKRNCPLTAPVCLLDNLGPSTLNNLPWLGGFKLHSEL